MADLILKTISYIIKIHGKNSFSKKNDFYFSLLTIVNIYSLPWILVLKCGY